MKKSLHITNGDSAADIIQSIVPNDDVLPWRDPMHHGPFSVAKNLDQASRIRALYLTGSDDLFTPDNIETLATRSEKHAFSERDEMLAHSHEYEEVVLWFEHDLLDQLQLLQLLSWYAELDNDLPKLSLICIDRFDGIELFRGIGQLSSEQMAGLLPNRLPIQSTTLELAEECWRAFRISDPTALLKLNKSVVFENEALPFLYASLFRYCQEFPWVSDGLSRTESQLLRLVGEGVTQPTQLFIQNMEFETHLYIGDWRTYSQLNQLCTAQNPFIHCPSGDVFKTPQTHTITVDDFRAQELRLTSFGESVLTGSASAIGMIQRREWLGGVYLDSDKAMWCWDEKLQNFSLA